MLLDEPLSGQDRPSQMVFIEKMNHLREQKTTLIMSCHEPFLMHSLSDIIYQVQDGGLSLRENPGNLRNPDISWSLRRNRMLCCRQRLAGKQEGKTAG